MKKKHGFLADRRGATAVEFALVALPFVMLLLGLIEFGRALHIKNGLDYAADRTQRQIIIDGTANSTELASGARKAFLAGDPNKLQVTLAAGSSGGTNFRTVRLSYAMTLLVPIPKGVDVVLSTSRKVVLAN